MNKINYYKLGTSMDADEIGKVSDREFLTQIIEFIDTENIDKKRLDLYQGFTSEHISSEIDMKKFKTHKHAKMTDLMSSHFFGNNGHFISKRLVNVLSDFNVEESKLLDCVITNKNNRYDYQVF